MRACVYVCVCVCVYVGFYLFISAVRVLPAFKEISRFNVLFHFISFSFRPPPVIYRILPSTVLTILCDVNFFGIYFYLFIFPLFYFLPSRS